MTEVLAVVDARYGGPKEFLRGVAPADLDSLVLRLRP